MEEVSTNTVLITFLYLDFLYAYLSAYSGRK